MLRSSSIPCTVPSSPRRPCSALNTHSNRPSRSTSHVSASRSTGVTSLPRARSAFATCSPERIETSRSADFPPRRTASLTRSFPTADHLDLGLQLDAEPALHLGHDSFDQLLDIARRRPTLVDDEVAVQRRHQRRALASALQPRRLDQPARRISRRVLEHAAAVLGLDRLRLAALSGELGHELLRLFPITPRQVDGGGDHQPAFQVAVTECRRPVAALESRRLPRLSP